MAVIEKSGLLKYKDSDGNTYVLYPITTMDNVSGLDEELGKMLSLVVSGDVTYIEQNGADITEQVRAALKALSTEGGTLTGGLAIEMDWGGFYLKDNSGRDGFFEKNSNSGAVNLGNLTDADNGQFITVNPETSDLSDAVTLTRNVDGTSTTHRIPTYSYGTEDLTAGTSPLETGKLYFVYE